MQHLSIRKLSFTGLVALAVFSVWPAGQVLASGTLIITSPAAGSTQSGTITLQAAASEQSSILAVQFLVDGSSVGPETGEVPYAYTYDTTQLTNGTHTIGARGRQISGDYIPAADVSINVSNAVPMTIDNLSVSSNSATCVTFSWTTSRPTSFQLDYGLSLAFGRTVSSALRATAHKVTIARLGAASPYYARIIGWDQNFVSATKADITFTTAELQGNAALPQVSLGSSKTGNSVSGSLTLTATPGEDLSPTGEGIGGVDGIWFLVDGVDVGTKVSSQPYTISFDTRTVPNGSHTFLAIIADRAGNTGISNAVTLSISNAGSSGASSGPSSSGAAVSVDSSQARLVNASGTFYLISSGQRYGITDPGVLASYGFQFKDASSATAADTDLPQASLLAPGEGSLVKKSSDPTVWFISGGAKRGFVSADVFLGQGFKWGNVLTVSAEVLDSLPAGSNLFDPSAAHLDGIYVNAGGTIYKIAQGTRRGIPSMDVYNSWNVDNDFSQVVPANAADLALPVGSNLERRSAG
ncbi:MAG: Ig-like domain-containing protein [Patescibacteria group bacterium]|nr:Ig-like domain-containing protein [Patescibacteria group bacterium]